MFDILPSSTGKGRTKIYLAESIKERNPLRYTFKVIKFCLMVAEKSLVYIYILEKTNDKKKLKLLLGY